MSLIVDIHKKLGDFRLDVQFEAGEETLALLGASGCGKSITLKCIAGILTPDSGRIVLNGVTLFDSERKIRLSPQERRTGLVFQNYALFPNMTVRKNVACGAMRTRDEGKRRQMTDEILEHMGLAALADQYPEELSGGQKQRVALARVLVSEPEILLLDEPFSALDSHLRFQLERDLRKLFAEFGKTVILVSHNREEVYRMADKVAIIQNGQVECVGEKRKIFQSPETRSGAVMTGCKNISRARKLDEHHVLAQDWGITLEVPEIPEDLQYVGIRMQDLTSGEGVNAFRAQVLEEVENPGSMTVFLGREEMSEKEVLGWELDKEEWKRLRAEVVTVSVPPERILLLRE